MCTSSAVVAFRCASEMSPRLKLSPPPALVWQFRQASLPGRRRSTAACRSDTGMFAVSGTNLKVVPFGSSFLLYAGAWQIRQSMFSSWSCVAIGDGFAPSPVWHRAQPPSTTLLSWVVSLPSQLMSG